MPVTTETTVEVSHTGDISDAAVETAVEKVRHVADHCREPVLHLEVRLALEPNPARDRPAIAESTLDVDGVPVRAHIAAGTVRESIDLLVERLQRRIRRHEERRHQLHLRHRTGESGPGKWRHGDLPTTRPEYLPLPYEEREVTRTKTFALDPISLDEALFDVEQLGHDFYLFVDEATGCDCVFAHGENGDIELCSVDPARYVDREVGDGASTNLHIPPALSLADAKEHLDASGGRYLFHRSEATGRGQVLYRRYDGHYGLVTPA